MEMTRKTVLVTGSSRGIGRATALEFARKGMNVVINYKSSHEKAEKVAREVEKFGVQALVAKADVSKEDEVRHMMDAVAKKFGKLDVLVNNAGEDVIAEIENLSVKDWKKNIDVYLTSVFLCMKYMIPLLKKSSSSSIVNIASRYGLKPCKGWAGYCCAKAGVLMLTQVGALELKKYGVRVNSFVPAPTDTELVRRVLPKKKIDELMRQGKMGKPEEAAEGIVKLALDEKMTGKTIFDKRLENAYEY